MGFRSRWLILAIFLTLNAHLASGCGEGSPRPPPGPGDSGPVDRGPDEPSFEGTCTVSLPGGHAETLDFGNAVLYSTLFQVVTIQNNATLPWEVRFGEIEPDGPAAFSLKSPAQAEPFTVPPGASVEVGLAFTPLATRNYRAYLPLEAPTWCNLARLEVVGAGVERVLLFEQQLEFFYVEPGNVATRELSLQNIGTRPVTFFFEAFLLTTPQSTLLARYRPFSIRAVNGVELGAQESGLNQPRVLPPDRSIITFQLAFRPGDNPNHAIDEPDHLPITGPHSAFLRMNTDDETLALAEIALTGIGGGPELATIPSTELNFKRVGFGSYFTKTITITNTGTNIPDTTADNLRFRHCRIEECATAQERPPEILLADGAPSPDFKLLHWPPADSGYRDMAGLEAQKSLQLEVMFRPSAEGSTPGPREALLHLYTNDPDDAHRTIRLVGEAIESPPCELEMNPLKVDFGVVEPGRSSPIHTPLLINRAQTPCLIYALHLEEETKEQGVFSLASDAKEDFFIEGGGTLAVPLRFIPTKQGAYSGVVSLRLHHPGANETSVLLVGSGGQPCIAMEPHSVEFSNVRVGCSAQARSVLVYNDCSNKQLSIQQASLVSSFNGNFQLVTPPRYGSPLEAAAGTSFSLIYKPSSIGFQATSVELKVVNGENAPFALYLPVRGTGTLDSRQTDRMRAQGGLPEVDLLFVIINSGGAYYQNYVASHFNLLATQGALQGVDYHVAVVSTDPGAGNGGSSGVIEGAFWPLSGTPAERIIKSSMPIDQQTRLFSKMIMMGPLGSGTEWLIDPAVAALSREMTREGAHNAGFLREDATLHIVTIADARDQAPHNLSQYQNFFRRLKVDKGFFFHGIIPVLFPGDCAYDGGPSSANDPRVKTMISDSGGYLGDICTTDWTTTLGELYQAVFKPRASFRLSNSPDLTNGIVVKLDGIEVPQRQGTEQIWRFDPTLGCCGAIVFEGAQVPTPGVVVEIAYDTACE